jgi:hypothetical protein
VATSIVLLAALSASGAQRPSPRVEDAGVKGPLGAQSVIANGIVSWDYWGIDLPKCTKRGGGEIECVLNIGNGVDESHELCVADPILKGSTTAPGSPMTITRVEKTNKESSSVVSSRADSYGCATYAPHDALNVVLTSHSLPPEGASVLSIRLVEHWRRSRSDSTLSARAEMPVIRVREPAPAK